MSTAHADRFWAKVNKTETCWLWISALDPEGYGKFRIGNRHPGAHRVAYELSVGPIPEGLHLDHLCRVRNCVNPDHLEPVTPKENTRRGEPANRTHCPNGHAYTPENTGYDRGKRRCLACGRAKTARYRAARQVAASLLTDAHDELMGLARDLVEGGYLIHRHDDGYRDACSSCRLTALIGDSEATA